MLKNRLNPFLCDKAAEMTTGGGAATVPAANPAAATTSEAAPTNGPPGATGATAAAATAPAATAEPTLLQRVKAAMADKGEILSERDAFKKRAEEAEGKLGSANTELATLKQENATMRGQLSELEAALGTSKAEKQTVERAAATQVATMMGVTRDELPEQAKEGGGLADLQAALEKETDPKKIVMISRQIDDLEAKQAEGGAD